MRDSFNFYSQSINWVELHFLTWLKPPPVTIFIGLVTDMTRRKADFIAENALLRQQLIVLHRQVKRPQQTNGDRLRLVLLARLTPYGSPTR